MKCLILAAGYATRLYPLTENFPKPLLPVGDKTILDHLIDDVDRSGAIDEYVVISNHRFFPHFEAWARTKKQKITLVDDGTTCNENRLGAVRDIQFAIESLEIHDDCLVLAGDNVLSFSLCRFVEYAGEREASCVLRYFEPDTQRLSKSGVLELGESDRVLSMEEKPAAPKSNWCCPPFYYYTAQAAASIPYAIREGCGTDAPGSFIAWLCKKMPVYAMEMPGKRFDIGNLQSYEEVKRTYQGIIE